MTPSVQVRLARQQRAFDNDLAEPDGRAAAGS
jgi:hypothetical protein